MLIEADKRIDLFEWTLQRILFAHLRPHFEHTRSRARRNQSLSRVAAACGVVLSALARFGSTDEDAAQESFRQGATKLRGTELQLLPSDRSGLAALDQALTALGRANARAVEQLLPACAAAIASDGIVSQAQGELMRAIADSLGAPMPPLLPGQRLA